MRSAIAIGLLVTALAGCQTTATPNLNNPGTTNLQQARALSYDPYPDPDAGPEIVGGRPPAFARPAAEVERARRFRSLWGPVGR